MEVAIETNSAAPLLYYIYPGTVFLCFVVTSLFSVFTLQHLRYERQHKPDASGKAGAVGLLGIFVVTYIVQLVTLVATTTSDKQWPPPEHTVVGNLSCLLVFGIQLCWLSGSEDIVWYPYQAAWASAFVFEAILGTCFIVRSRSRSLWLDRYGVVELALIFSRCMILLTLTLSTFIGPCIRAIRYAPDAERQPLLANGVNANESGSDAEAPSDQQAEFNWERRKREARESMEKRLREEGNWFAYANGFMVSAQLTNFVTS